MGAAAPSQAYLASGRGERLGRGTGNNSPLRKRYKINVPVECVSFNLLTIPSIRFYFYPYFAVERTQACRDLYKKSGAGEMAS